MSGLEVQVPRLYYRYEGSIVFMSKGDIVYILLALVILQPEIEVA